MKQKTAFQRVMAFLLSAVLTLSLCTTAFAAQPGKAEPRGLLVGEEFSIVVNVGYMENGSFVKTGSKTMVSTCCYKTGHAGYNHTMDAEKIVKESGYTYTSWRVTRNGYWDAPASTTVVHYTISGKAPYKADEAIWVIGEKPPVEPGNPGGGDGNGSGSDTEETVKINDGTRHHWKQTLVYHANYPGNSDPTATVKYEVNALSPVRGITTKTLTDCGFSAPDGYELKSTNWYAQADGGNVLCRMSGTYNLSKANNGKVIHLYAQYTAKQVPVNTFTMTYDANGGLVEDKASHTLTITTTEKSHNFGTYFAERAGYTFQGWYTAANGGDKIEWPYVMSVTDSETSASKTVYAHWEADKVSYTVTRYDNEENVIDTVTREGVTDETVAIQESDKALAGYTFNEGDSRNVLQTVLGSSNELKLYFTKNAPDWTKLQITQTADKETVQPNETVTYTIQVTNNTGFDLTSMTVTEQLDRNLFHVRASENGKYVGTSGVAWTMDSLKNGETATMTLTAEVTGTVGNGTLVRTNATITDAAAGMETLPEDMEPQAGTEIISIVYPDPDWTKLDLKLAADKTKARRGDTVIYTLQVTNNTGRDLTGITVNETLGTTQVVRGAEGDGQYAGGTRNIWTIDSLENGQTATVKITVQVSKNVSSTTIYNTATIKTAAAGDDTLPATANVNETVQISVDYTVAPKWTELSITQTVDKTKVRPGTAVTFTIEVTNNTGRDLTGITVTDEMDNNMRFVSDNGNGSYANNVWTIDSLKNGKKATLTITAWVNGTTHTVPTVTNTVSITSAAAGDENLPEGTELQAVTPVTMDYTVAPMWNGLRISQSVSGTTVKPSGEVTFTIQVMNRTGRDLTNITVHDKLDQNLQFVSAEGTGTYDKDSGVWTIASLEKGHWAELTITAKVRGTTTAKTITNTATITGAFADEDELPATRRPQATMMISVG